MRKFKYALPCLSPPLNKNMYVLVYVRVRTHTCYWYVHIDVDAGVRVCVNKDMHMHTYGGSLEFRISLRHVYKNVISVG